MVINSGSNSMNPKVEFNVLSSAYAEIHQVEDPLVISPGRFARCYSSMSFNQGSRTVECNTPCCYRNNLKSNGIFGYCNSRVISSC